MQKSFFEKYVNYQYAFRCVHYHHLNAVKESKNEESQHEHLKCSFKHQSDVKMNEKNFGNFKFFWFPFLSRAYMFHVDVSILRFQKFHISTVSQTGWCLPITPQHVHHFSKSTYTFARNKSFIVRVRTCSALLEIYPRKCTARLNWSSFSKGNYLT